jgi:L-malate glycosyltransferase
MTCFEPGEGGMDAVPAAPKIGVMQLVYSLQIGGSEKVAFDISAHLDSAAFRPHMCALDLDGPLGEELVRRNIGHHVLHRKGIEPDVTRRLYRLLRQQRIDVVHTHHFTQLLFAALPARLAGARIVHTEHEYFSYLESAAPRALIGPLSRLCDHITVVGHEIAAYFSETIGIPRSRIELIPNGVAVERFTGDREAARRSLALPPDAMIVGTIGRLEPEKDHMTLLRAFGQVRAFAPSARLVIVGDGSLASALRIEAERMGLAGATHFLGYQKDVATVLAALDLFVLTSVREGLPISVIEAQAAGRPVVVSHIGSIRDLVRDGEQGLTVAPGDAEGFAAAMRRLIESPALRAEMGGAGRRQVERSFSLFSVVHAYENLYRTAAMKHHVRH